MTTCIYYKHHPFASKIQMLSGVKIYQVNIGFQLIRF